MSAPSPSGDTPLPFKKIFHPTDFSVDSHTALHHAVKLAAATQAELSIMHIDPEVARADFEDFPRISPILKRWQILPPASTEEHLVHAGVSIRKARAASSNPTEALLRHLAAHPADLLVMATHQYSVLEQWQHRTVAEPVARGSHIPTLFVPTHVEGFVVKETGELKLRCVLIPVNETPNPQTAIEWTARLALTLGCEKLTGQLIHVGDDRMLNSLRYPTQKGLVWRTMICRGDVVDVILGMGADFDVDLIVMPTEGHHSLLDLLRGSTMECVLRGARCPLLAIPTPH
jgi:nucleotide-binding universal stress UspA family protein